MEIEVIGLSCRVAAALAPILGGTAHAQCQARSVVLTGESGIAADEGFGFAVDLEGEVAAVGASGGGARDGRVTVFRNIGGAWGWPAETALQPHDPADRIGFGRAVALMNESVLVIGAPGAGAPGRAFVYEFDGIIWSETARLSPNGGAGFADAFGAALVALEDLLVVGAPFDRAGGVAAGAAYIYRRAPDGAWTLDARLTAPQPQADAEFGAAATFVPGGLLVSEPGGDDYGTGALHVFVADDAWSWSQEIGNFWGTSRFGRAMATESGVAFVSDYYEVYRRGSVEIFAPDSGWEWKQTGRLGYNGACKGQINGGAVDAQDGVVAVGAPTDADGLPPHSGFVQLYRSPPGWDRREQFVNPVGNVEADGYGHAVALDRGRLLVGAPEDVPGAGRIGLAHLTEISDASPAILDHPLAWLTLQPGDAGSLEVVASGDDPLVYQWQYRDPHPDICDYGDIPEGDGFSGTQTPILHIAPDWPLGTSFAVRCRVSNGCGTTYTNDARVDVQCIADCTRDGLVDTRDFTCYLNGWVSRHPLFDINHDGEVNTLDFIAFLNYWNEGC